MQKKENKLMMIMIKRGRQILNGITILIFLMMFSIVTINVVARYVFNAPIPWAGELSRYSFVSIIYLGAIIAFRDKAHIGLDILLEYFPDQLRKVIDNVSKILVAGFLIIFIYEGLKMTLNSIHTKSAAMLISMAIPYIFLPIGGIGMLCELIIDVVKPKESSEGVAQQ